MFLLIKSRNKTLQINASILRRRNLRNLSNLWIFTLGFWCSPGMLKILLRKQDSHSFYYRFSGSEANLWLRACIGKVLTKYPQPSSNLRNLWNLRILNSGFGLNHRMLSTRPRTSRPRIFTAGRLYLHNPKVSAIEHAEWTWRTFWLANGFYDSCAL